LGEKIRNAHTSTHMAIGHWIVDTGYWIVDTGHWTLDTAWQMAKVAIKLKDASDSFSHLARNVADCQLHMEHGTWKGNGNGKGKRKRMWI